MRSLILTLALVTLFAFGSKAQICVNTDSTFALNACDSIVSPSGRYVWNSSGTYFDTIPNSGFCDSLMTIILNVNQSTSSVLNIQSCNSYTSPSGRYTWMSSGTVMDTLTTSGGCDSILTINLTIDTSTFSIRSARECDSLRSPSGKHLWTSTGTYTDTLVNSVGCDSIITFSLVINNSAVTNLNVSSCYSYTVPSGDTSYTLSGKYVDHLTTAAGCDSTLNINLSIVGSSFSRITANACDQYTSPSGNYTWTSGGNYQDTIPNANGCDSVISISLNITNSSSKSINVQACESYISPSGLYTWTSSGNYKDTLSNAKGCDSVLTINLSIDTATSANIPLIVCDSYTLPSGRIVASNGTYRDTIANAAGCDSLMSFVLVFYQSSSSSISDTACGVFTSPSGRYSWTSSGSYQDTIQNSEGCDSIISFDITIENADTAVLQTGPNSLSAQANGASFQWLDCDNAFAPISGASGKNFFATQNGNYAVEVTQNGCTTRSACYPIGSVGVEHLEKNSIKFSPNPTDGNLHIDLSGKQETTFIQIVDSKGALAFRGEYKHQEEIDLQFDGSAGIYSVLVSTSKGERLSFKLMKN